MFDRTLDPIVVGLDDVGVLPVRLCLSPHCTTLASLVEGAGDGGWGRPGSEWRRLIRRRAAGMDLSPLAPYTAREGFPGFLTSSLRNPAPTFASQVSEVRSVSPDRVRSELAAMFPTRAPDAYQPFLDDPASALERLCRTLREYFDRVVAPSWPGIERFLQREILRQGYALATRDARDALNGIHPSIIVDGAELRLRSGGQGASTALRERVLMLTPLFSAEEGILADLDGSSHIKIGYAAAGAEEFWSGVERTEGALANLVGPSRARILLALQSKATTTALSTNLYLAPASVSAHLKELSRLNLIERTREGRWVYYALNANGEALVSLFDEPGAAGRDLVATPSASRTAAAR